MPRRKAKPATPSSRAPGQVPAPRIIGGEFRGRRLLYSGDVRTRPMKDRVREAVFNLLGPTVAGKWAFDLFAGTGALGLEAISRGAMGATFIEQHRPTAQLIGQNTQSLGVADRCQVVTGNTFAWFRGQTQRPTAAWLVFSSPPYDFYVDRAEEMLGLLSDLYSAAPPESLFVVEADARFDYARLPSPDQWDIRRYPPAVIGILHKSLP